MNVDPNKIGGVKLRITNLNEYTNLRMLYFKDWRAYYWLGSRLVTVDS